MIGKAKSRAGRAWVRLRVLPVIWVLLMPVGGTSMLAGCSAQPRHIAAQDDDRLEAHPLDDDDSLADKAGQVGVVGIVLGVIVGGILMPLFLV